MPHVQLNTGSGGIELKRNSAPRRDGDENAGMRSAPLILTLREIEAIERIPLRERARPTTRRHSSGRTPTCSATSHGPRISFGVSV
jgi:hypothetical protein